MNTCGYFQDSAYSCCSHAVISADTQWACYKDTSTAAEQIIFNIIVENGGNFTTVSDSAETLMECFHCDQMGERGESVIIQS